MIDHMDFDDPRPANSPRLYGDVEKAPGRKTGEVRGSKMTAAALKRLRLIACVYAMRDRKDPVPYSTIVKVLKISENTAISYYKIGCGKSLRRSRV
jgi:hypothetical protein